MTNVAGVNHEILHRVGGAADLSADYLVKPGGTPTVGQVPTVVTVSPLALTFQTPSGGGGGGTSLLASTSYDPSTEATYAITSTTSVDVDATNLALTVTPTTTSALVVMSIPDVNPPNNVACWFTLRIGSSDIAGTTRRAPFCGTTLAIPVTASWLLTGLTAGTAVTVKLGAKTTSGTLNVQVGDAGSGTGRHGPFVAYAFSV